MEINVYFDEEHHVVMVDPDDITAGHTMFQTMDKDMDYGWRMGPEFIEHPDPVQRAQIVANRLMIALESQNESMIKAMSAYIAAKIPNIRELHIDTTGEPLLTEIITR
ncbi:MAG: hypothetical protein EP297_12020 [Gammaproteobacteria bacterium]|nr:MAG: hypothetical protein EP297_12020 [Gammaproteobacteria bacterium]